MKLFGVGKLVIIINILRFNKTYVKIDIFTTQEIVFCILSLNL